MKFSTQTIAFYQNGEKIAELVKDFFIEDAQAKFGSISLDES